jgi:hypothetical protein
MTIVDADDDFDDDLYAKDVIIEPSGGKGVKGGGGYTFKLQITDRIPTLAPFRDTTLAMPSLYSGFPYNAYEKCKDLEIVACGFDSIIVCQLNLRPRILESFDFPGAEDMWVVQRKKGISRFIVLGKESGCTVIETPEVGGEWRVIERSGFDTRGRVVWVGAIGNVAVQVLSEWVLLVDYGDARLLEKFSIGEMEEGASVVQCSVVDRIIALVLDNGTCLVLSVDDVRISLYARIRNGGISCACVYADGSGRFSKGNGTGKGRTGLSARVASHVSTGGKRSAAPRSSIVASQTSRKARMSYRTDVDDLYGNDEELYGDGIVEEPEEDVEMEERGNVTPPVVVELNVWRDEGKSVDEGERRYYLSIVRENGDLEVLQLSNVTSCFYIPRFDLFPASLVDGHFHEEVEDEEVHGTRILEVVLLDLGNGDKECYLFVSGGG